MYPVLLVAAHQAVQAEEYAEKLGQNGGVGRAVHIQAKNRDKHDIQNHIGDGRDDQVL